MNNLVGQVYNGAENMSGQPNEVKSRIPKEMFLHCVAYRLNLALFSALSSSSFRNSLGLIMIL